MKVLVPDRPDHRDENGRRRDSHPPFVTLGLRRFDELRGVDDHDPAIVAVGDVLDDGGAFGIVERSFDETAEVFGLRMSEEHGHEGTSPGGGSGTSKLMCRASAPWVSMSPMSLFPTPAARSA